MGRLPEVGKFVAICDLSCTLQGKWVKSLAIDFDLELSLFMWCICGFELDGEARGQHEEDEAVASSGICQYCVSIIFFSGGGLPSFLL